MKTKHIDLLYLARGNATARFKYIDCRTGFLGHEIIFLFRAIFSVIRFHHLSIIASATSLSMNSSSQIQAIFLAASSPLFSYTPFLSAVLANDGSWSSANTSVSASSQDALSGSVGTPYRTAGRLSGSGVSLSGISGKVCGALLDRALLRDFASFSHRVHAIFHVLWRCSAPNSNYTSWIVI